MTSNTISVIVPVYNAAEYLRTCLDSVVNQTYRDLEIICVDDGSLDESPAILREYAEHDDRIVLLHSNNCGPSEARNKALDMAKGKYLLFVDSDDWIELNTCEIALDSMNKSGAELIMWDYILEKPSSSRPKQIFNCDVAFSFDEVRSRLHRRMIGITGSELAHPEKADSLCTVWGKLYQRDYIEKNNIRFYDIKLIGTYEDGLFNLNVFEHVKKALYINRPMYHYRKDVKDSCTSKYNPNLQQQRIAIYNYMQEYISSHNLGEEYRKALQNRIALDLIPLVLTVMSRKEHRMKKIKEILKKTENHQAYKQLDFKFLAIHWKVFYMFAVLKSSIGIFLMGGQCDTWQKGSKESVYTGYRHLFISFANKVG